MNGRICDICGVREATLFESVVVDNNPVEYAYCQSCYERALKSGKSPHEEADFRLSRRTKECKYCGYTVEDFQKVFCSVAQTVILKCAKSRLRAQAKRRV